jgi:ABC-type amino acid transport substrate-binding protein
MAASPPVVPGRIFISYRREDSAYPAGWLFDRLAVHFRGGQVFKDVDSIELGDDFVEVITRAVASCDVLLALIGPEWLTITDESGRRRLDSPDDFVRLEIEAALTRNVRVIPILIDEASMPRADELPPSLAGLVRRQALELSPNRFDFDTGRLLKVLDKTLAEVRTEQFDAALTGRPETGPPRPSTSTTPAQDAPERREHARPGRTPSIPPGVAATPGRARPWSKESKPPGEQRRPLARPRLVAGVGAGVVLIALLVVALVLRPQPSPTVLDPGNASSDPTVTPLPPGTRQLEVAAVDGFASAEDNPGALLEDFDPILFADPEDGWQGLDVDLANALGDKLDVEFVFKDVGRLRTLGAVRKGSVDIGLSVLQDRAESRQAVDFIDYLDPGAALLVPRDNPDGIRSLEALCGRTVVRPIEMAAGSVIAQSHRCETNGEAPITLVSCPKVSSPPPDAEQRVPLRDCPARGDPLRLVIDGWADAAVLDFPVAERLLQTSSIGQQLTIANPPLEAEPYGIAVRKGNDEVRDALRSALQAIIADGTYDKILAKWGVQDLALTTASVNSRP